jgi:hypothetical protein
LRAQRNLIKQLEESNYFNEIHFKGLTTEQIEQEYNNSLNLLNIARETRNDLVKRVRNNYRRAYQFENIKGKRDQIKKLLDLERAYKTIKAYRILHSTWFNSK